MHTSDTRVTARLMCACKCAVIRLSDVFDNWAGSPITDVHENVQWANCLTLCTFTCTRQTHGSLHVYMQLMRACKGAVIRLSDVFDNWAVSPMTDVCMKMCSEPIVWLSAHLHAHVRHPGHCTFTCTWCVLVNVQWSVCFMCSCNWAVNPMTDVCMKMCSEPIVWLSAHLHAHVRHMGHCTFTCTWCVHVNVDWSDCPMCSCKWGVSRVTEMFMEMCSEPSVWLTAHLHAHVRYSRVTAR